MKGYNSSKKLNIDMSKRGELDKAFKMLGKASNIDEATLDFVDRLVSSGVEYAKSIVPVDTGELKMNIDGEVAIDRHIIKGTITARSDHAAYVEFGVGVVGEGTYPGDTQGYQYNMPSMWKDMTGGWWYGKGYRVYTHGNKANPFMYKTSKYMEDMATILAKETLNDY